MDTQGTGKILPANGLKGTYLAVDMGGTNIRVCVTTFNGDGTYALSQDNFAIPTALMTSSNSRDLFDWVARMVHDFFQDLNPTLAPMDDNSA